MFDCQRQAMSTSSPFRSPPRRCLEEDRQHSWTETSSGIMGFHHGVHDDLFMESHWRNKSYIYIFLFPTCQVGLLDFITAVPAPPPSSPPRPPSPPPPLPIHFHVHFCLANSSLFANFRAQWALLDLNCRLPIWVGTAGPQPQGSERSGHRWTSTRDLPSPVGTAGPQPGTFRAQWAPLDLSGQMECQNICQKDCQNICQIDCQNICHIECHIECQNICEKECHIEYMPDRTPKYIRDKMLEDMPDRISE